MNDVVENVPMKVGKFQYFLAALSFIPVLGFLVGVILIPISLFSKKRGANRIAAISSSGVMLWALVFLLHTPDDPTKNIRPLVLDNGNTVYPLSEGEMYFSSGGATAYTFKYQTTVDIDKKIELKEEAKLVWRLLQSNVDKTDYKIAALSASAPRVQNNYFVSTNKSFGFIVKKSENGRWSFKED